MTYSLSSENWFQSLPLKCNVHRYIVALGTLAAASGESKSLAADLVGRCKLNSFDP
jgi:hypothetical protein